MSETPNVPPRHQYEAFLRQLPADWEQKEITQVGAVVGGGTPSRAVPSFWRGSIPWVTPGEVSGEAAKLLHDTNEHISASGLAGSGANLLPTGSLLVTTRATLGARVINAVPMATNQGFKSIVFKKPEEASYYYHLFEKVKPELVRRASGTTFLEISSAEFASIKVPSPSPSEKMKIAELLDTLDTAIHQTEAIVKKLKQVKQGLLHDLLTRGLDASGELRPDRSEAPDHYQPSPMGWVPKAWSLGSVGAEFDIQLGKMLDAKKNLGVYKSYIGNKAVQWAGIDMSAAQLVKMTRSDLVRFRLAKGDLLVCEGGEVGRAAIWEDPVEECYCQKALHRLRPLRGYSSHLMLAFLRYWTSRDMLANYVSQTSIAHLTQEKLASVPLPVPDPEEQFAVAERLVAQDAKARSEEQRLAKLKATKAGLLDDLLTGRIRVTPLLAQ
ncbi:type I restriction enzyme S subunit [Acidovorax delafieldii]|uniref:Type I restriction enzyme S subunit n=1 Tax=Acidovorax delafieldii TaxID=47920 RepID=A0A561XF63_ACIDE|nr:restriction endonuclease subunit S [Acidovorax delafieldii]TWG34760.1 type I restriction enzyme S subunit [Acidovorax delafieldii]